MNDVFEFVKRPNPEVSIFETYTIISEIGTFHSINEDCAGIMFFWDQDSLILTQIITIADGVGGIRKKGGDGAQDSHFVVNNFLKENHENSQSMLLALDRINTDLENQTPGVPHGTTFIALSIKYYCTEDLEIKKIEREGVSVGDSFSFQCTNETMEALNNRQTKVHSNMKEGPKYTVGSSNTGRPPFQGEDQQQLVIDKSEITSPDQKVSILLATDGLNFEQLDLIHEAIIKKDSLINRAERLVNNCHRKYEEGKADDTTVTLVDVLPVGTRLDPQQLSILENMSPTTYPELLKKW